MSRLEELIRELCPDGVEYKFLGDIASISRGGNFQKKDYVETGVPCIHYGQIYTSYGMFPKEAISYISSEVAKKQKYAVHGDIIMAVTSENMEDICKCVAWLGNEPVAISGHTAIIKHNINAKYLVYYFNSQHFQRTKCRLAHGTKVMEVTPDHLNKIQLPVPPLPVQEEIVKILDKFTNYVTELQAELQARKQQYEYYRELLLSDNDDIPRIELRSVIKKSCSGGTPKKTNKLFYENGTIPWIRTQDVKFNNITSVDSFITEEAVAKTSAKWIPENCVIVAISGASAGRCAVNKIKATTNQHCLNLEIDENKALYKYVYYCIYNQYSELLDRKQGARGDLNSSLILGITIPLPEIEEQERIVTILENFDGLISGLESGLPAEIEARQKQYEYYRDKLLSFKELK